jgi:hypothetical protein
LQPAGVWQQVDPAPHAAPPLQEQAKFVFLLHASPVLQVTPAHTQRRDVVLQVIVPLGLPVPTLHCVSLVQPHVMFWQLKPGLQALPQPPQLALFAVVSVSQPLSACGHAGVVQLPKPSLHVEVHKVSGQSAEATFVSLHVRNDSHPPQCSTVPLIAASQPSVNKKLQSP